MRWLLALWFVAFVAAPRALAAEPSVSLDSQTPSAAQKEEKKEKEKSKEEKAGEISAAEKEAERKRKDKLARVVVLKWQGTDADYRDLSVQRNIKSRIARPDAQFFPEVDLYQEGRKVRDRTVVPAMQPATVPNQNIDRVMASVNEVSSIPYNAWSPSDWGLKAAELRDMVELLWFVERVELREPLFLLYAQIGRAAENQNEVIPPFYEQIGFQAVNYYYYMAAVLATQDPALMSKLTDSDVNASVSQYLQMLQQGAFPTLKVDFEQDGVDFDKEGFDATYELFFNGIPIQPDDDGQMDVFLGRTDIYLKRVDSGHGLSERLEVSKLEDKRYFVRDVARKKMGLDFIDQLFLHPNECTPALEGDILNYLSIYAKIHEKAEIYIAVPKEGNPNKVYLWRYDRPTSTLQRVGGGDDDFPVRFAVQLAGGIAYTSVPTVGYAGPDESDAASQAASGSFSVDPTSAIDIETIPAIIPLTFEVRGHYNRLALGWGAEAGFNLGGESGDQEYVERYILPGREDGVVYDNDDDVNYDSPKFGDTFQTEADPAATDDGDGDAEVVAPDWSQQYHTDFVNRTLYITGGVVLGRDAGLGLGPRIMLRAGWSNMPYALVTTAHFGWNFALPLKKPIGNRIRPYVDVDGRVGAVWPFRPSLAWEAGHGDGDIAVSPIFALTAGIGTTL